MDLLFMKIHDRIIISSSAKCGAEKFHLWRGVRDQLDYGGDLQWQRLWLGRGKGAEWRSFKILIHIYIMIIFITGRAWGLQWDSVCLWSNWMWQKLLNARHHWPTDSEGNHSKVNCHHRNIFLVGFTWNCHNLQGIWANLWVNWHIWEHEVPGARLLPRDL